MQLYFVTEDAKATPRIADTREAAHEYLKGMKYGVAPRIDLYEVGTDKASIRRILDDLFNGEPNDTPSGLAEGVCSTKPLRTWELTPRGGLKEIEPGE